MNMGRELVVGLGRAVHVIGAVPAVMTPPPGPEQNDHSWSDPDVVLKDADDTLVQYAVHAPDALPSSGEAAVFEYSATDSQIFELLATFPVMVMLPAVVLERIYAFKRAPSETTLTGVPVVEVTDVIAVPAAEIPITRVCPAPTPLTVHDIEVPKPLVALHC